MHDIIQIVYIEAIPKERDKMTDSEKLDLLLDKITGLEKDMIDVKAELKRLHRNDDLILDEVERVHILFEKHRTNQSVHTA